MFDAVDLGKFHPYRSSFPPLPPVILTLTLSLSKGNGEESPHCLCCCPFSPLPTKTVILSAAQRSRRTCTALNPNSASTPFNGTIQVHYISLQASRNPP